MRRHVMLVCGVLLFAATVFAQTQATIATCGTVTLFTAATSTTTGLITIAGQPFVIAAGTTLQNQALATAGANVCLTAAVNLAGQLTDPATMTANVNTTLSLCGTVSAYTAASAVGNGSITIAGRTLPIAAGTSISNADLITIGANLCLQATLNGAGQIVAPSSVSANVSSTLSLCGTVSAYTAATATAAGSLTIAGRTIAIAAGTTIDNSNLITAGADLCLNATLDAMGEIIVPSSVRLHAASTITICGTVTAYAAATASSAGSITIAGRSFTIAAGTTITNGDAIRVGVSICLDATVDVNNTIIPPTSVQPDHPPVLNVPGPQSVSAGNTLRFDVSASDEDSGDSVHINASGVPQNAAFTPRDGNPAGGSFTFTPSDGQANQTFTVVFTATDNAGASDSKSVSIQVTPRGGSGNPPVNHPPTLSVPGPQYVSPDHTLTFRVAASDPDGDSVTLSAAPLPPHSSFDPPSGTFTMTPSSDQVGNTYTITFTARDTHDAETSRNVDVHVVTNSDQFGPPVISVPPSPYFVNPGEPDSFTVTATPQKPQCSVSLTASGLPAGAAFNPATGVFTFTASTSQAGQMFRVTFRASDCDNRTSVAVVDVIVRTTAPPPQNETFPNVCVPVSEIVFNGSCGSVRIPIRNDSDGDVSIGSVRLDDGSTFHISGAPSGSVILPAHSSIDIDVSFDGDPHVPASDRIVIRSGVDGSSTTEVSVRNGEPRHKAAQR